MGFLRPPPFDRLRERRTRNDRFYKNESHDCSFKLVIQPLLDDQVQPAPVVYCSLREVEEGKNVLR